MTYEGLKGMASDSDPALGGNVHNGDPFSFAPSAWNYLVNRFCAKSVLDVGCGQGHAARYMASLGCDVIAIDGLEDNLVDSVYPVAIHDLRKSEFKTKVDLVYSVEVVEHIEQSYLENLLKTLTCGKILAMTHAVPGQGGHHHVNCQPWEYWRDHLLRFGFVLMQEDTSRFRYEGGLTKAVHIEKSGLVFGRH